MAKGSALRKTADDAASLEFSALLDEQFGGWFYRVDSGPAGFYPLAQ